MSFGFNFLREPFAGHRSHDDFRANLPSRVLDAGIALTDLFVDYRSALPSLHFLERRSTASSVVHNALAINRKLMSAAK